MTCKSRSVRSESVLILVAKNDIIRLIFIRSNLPTLLVQYFNQSLVLKIPASEHYVTFNLLYCQWDWQDFNI